MPTLSVLFFASAREVVGCKQASFTLPASPPPTVASLVKHVVNVHPRLQTLLPSLTLAINLEYVAVDSEQALAEKDEIAFIPPIAGG